MNYRMRPLKIKKRHGSRVSFDLTKCLTVVYGTTLTMKAGAWVIRWVFP